MSTEALTKELDFFQSQVNLLLLTRDRFGLFARHPGEKPAEKREKIFLRMVLAGEGLPNVSAHREDLVAGIAIGDIIVGTVIPRLFQDISLIDQLVTPYLGNKAMNYLQKYIAHHGMETHDPVISRTDMLLSNVGLKALEINPDGPEGFTLSWAREQIDQQFNPNERQTPTNGLWRWYINSFETVISRYERENGKKPRVIIPYNHRGTMEDIDSFAILQLLTVKGYDVVAKPLNQISGEDAADFDLALKTFAVGWSDWEKDADTPFFTDDRWTSKKIYPPPWVDAASLKHFIALLWRSTYDLQFRHAWGISDQQIAGIKKVMLPTYSTYFHTHEEITRAYYYNGNGAGGVAKGNYSSHGDEFREDKVLERVLSGNHILQKKVTDASRTGPIVVMHPDGSISKETGWLIDMCPMGVMPDDNLIVISRMCPQHPMNIAGPNGGGFIHPRVN